MEENHTKLNRRDALKALAASGGALAAAFLPAKWTKPVVKTGVLPAHAQSTFICPSLTLESHGPCISEQICPEGGRFFVKFSWLPSLPWISWSLNLGGVPVDVVHTVWGIGYGEIYFNPGAGFSGYNAVLTMTWPNNCFDQLNWEEFPEE